MQKGKKTAVFVFPFFFLKHIFPKHTKAFWTLRNGGSYADPAGDTERRGRRRRRGSEPRQKANTAGVLAHTPLEGILNDVANTNRFLLILNTMRGVPLFVSLSLHLYIHCLSICQCMCMYVSIYPSIYLFLSRSLTLSPTFSRSLFSHPPSLSFSLTLSLSFSLPSPSLNLPPPPSSSSSQSQRLSTRNESL